MKASFKTFLKYFFLAWFGGATYVAFEVFYRGRSHWTMFILAAFLFVTIGLLNNALPWDMGLVWQVLVGTALVTVLELAVGIVVNLWMDWNVWDYSNMPGNILGQICPQYSAAWVPLVLLCIVVDDVLRWQFFGEEKPMYTLLK